MNYKHYIFDEKGEVKGQFIMNISVGCTLLVIFSWLMLIVLFNDVQTSEPLIINNNKIRYIDSENYEVILENGIVLSCWMRTTTCIGSDNELYFKIYLGDL